MGPILSEEGRRLYIRTAYGDPCVAALKQIGSHWDPESKRWWISTARRAAVETALARAAASPVAEDPDAIRLVGKARYRGRTYYVRALTDAGRARLCTLDLRVDFWTAVGGDDGCEVMRTYEPRTYRGRTEYTTIGSLHRFLARQADPATRQGPCTECGTWGPSGEPCASCGGEGTHV